MLGFFSELIKILQVIWLVNEELDTRMTPISLSRESPLTGK
jgi:hypothetical protein